MFCSNCGKTLNQGEKFCANCGMKIENEINMVNNIDSSYNQNISFDQSINSTQKPQRNNKKILFIILGIVGCVIVGFIILIIKLISGISSNSDKLICNSSVGKITIMYNESGIIGYTAIGYSYDLDGQQKYAKEVGMDAYITEFNNWFVSNTSGSCTVNGIEIKKEEINENVDNTNNNTNNNNATDVNTQTTIVGDNIYGYITVPKNWAKFYDIDGNTSLQYSYGNIYIVSVNYFEDNSYTAQQLASNFMYNKQNSSDVTGVTGATVQIGINKEYTAYQVYMYYPYDNVYLITYWFETEDGKVRYIALEGPGELNGISISDYLYIPESFSLNKTF